jgi:signal peptidase I
MNKHLLKAAREYKGLLLFFVLMVMFRSAIADWNDVPTGSMKPTIIEGDRIFVNKLAYDLRVPLTHISLARLGEPARGDIVVFDSHAADQRLVKRVIGLPGDLVQMVSGRLLVNGRAAKYSDVRYEGNSMYATETIGELRHIVRYDYDVARAIDSFGPVRVPDDHYLMLGDNRRNSADSRYYGFVPRDEIVGRSRTVVLSLDLENYLMPRTDRFVDPLDKKESVGVGG